MVTFRIMAALKVAAIATVLILQFQSMGQSAAQPQNETGSAPMPVEHRGKNQASAADTIILPPSTTEDASSKAYEARVAQRLTTALIAAGLSPLDHIA